MIPTSGLLPFDHLRRACDSTETKSLAIFAITEILPSENTIRGTLNDDVFEITITSEGMVNNHFVNPTYTVDINGRKYSYKLDNGMACMSCSTKISYVVQGMLRINGKIQEFDKVINLIDESSQMIDRGPGPGPLYKNPMYHCACTESDPYILNLPHTTP